MKRFELRRGLDLVRLASIGACLSSPITALAAEPEKLDAEDANKVVGEVDTELGKMREDLDVVARGYGEPLPKNTGNKVERRLREGEIHYLLNDFMRASIVLLDVVDDEANKSHARYPDCVYFLAESMRKTGNHSGARKYFEEILDKASGERLKDIVLALLEIANETGHYEGVDRYIARLREAGGLSRPDVDYIHAKMLFKAAGDDVLRLQGALDVFEKIPPGNNVSPQSAYYAGVVLVRLGKVDQAIAKFREAAERGRAAPDGTGIRELAFLSLGRIYHEIGDTPKAIDAYQEIAQSSPHFSDMLFEVAWTHVKAANKTENQAEKQKHLTMALRTSEILMASAPDHQLYPEARILEGNLQIQLGAPETAYETFQTIIDRYGGARQKLGELLDTIGDPKEFFDQIIAEDMRTVRSTAFLPPVAIEWAIRSPQVRQAVGMITDIRESDAYLKEGRNLIRVMNEALKGEQRYAMFPGLSEARAKAFSIENRMVLLNRRLLNLERAMLLPSLSQAENAELEVLLARRRALEEDIKNLPATADQVVVATVEIRGQYTATERRVFRLGYQVASMRAQVAAAEVWLAQNRSNLSEEQIKIMSERLIATRNAIADIEARLDTLGADVKTAQAISGGDGGRVRAQRVREAYTAVMVNEAALLSNWRSRLPPDLSSFSPRIDGQRKALQTMGADLHRLQTVLDEQIENRVSEIRDQLALELRRLEKYEEEHVGLRGETDQMLGPVAADSLRSVVQDFKDLVRKADVGIIDVAWQRKQQETKRVNELVEKQQERAQELEDEYSDVLEER